MEEYDAPRSDIEFFSWNSAVHTSGAGWEEEEEPW